MVEEKDTVLWSGPSQQGLPDGSVGKESTCNAGDPGLTPRSGRSAGEGIGYLLPVFLGFLCGSAGKESTCNVRDLGSSPGLGRSPGEGKRYPLQYSGLENSMECIVLGVAKSQTRLSDFQVNRISELREKASKLVEMADIDSLFVELCWEGNRHTELKGRVLQRVLRALVFGEWCNMHVHWGM